MTCACRVAGVAFLAPALLAAPARGEDQPVGAPLHCAQLGDDRQLCTWRVGSTHAVCERDAEGRPTGKPCVRRPDNESMQTFPVSGVKRTVSHRSAARVAARDEARAAFDRTRSLDDVVRLIGAGPLWCRRDGSLVCGWHVRRRTPGYVTVARAADAPGKKVGVVCAFAPDGGTRSGPCTLERAGRPPRPPD